MRDFGDNVCGRACAFGAAPYRNNAFERGGDGDVTARVGLRRVGFKQKFFQMGERFRARRRKCFQRVCGYIQRLERFGKARVRAACGFIRERHVEPFQTRGEREPTYAFVIRQCVRAQKFLVRGIDLREVLCARRRGEFRETFGQHASLFEFGNQFRDGADESRFIRNRREIRQTVRADQPSQKRAQNAIARAFGHQTRQRIRAVENGTIQRVKIGERDAERGTRQLAQPFAERTDLCARGQENPYARQGLGRAYGFNLLKDVLCFARAGGSGEEAVSLDNNLRARGETRNLILHWFPPRKN